MNLEHMEKGHVAILEGIRDQDIEKIDIPEIEDLHRRDSYGGIGVHPSVAGCSRRSAAGVIVSKYEFVHLNSLRSLLLPFELFF